MMLLGVHFVQPEWLFVAAVIPFAYLLSVQFQKGRQKRLEQFSSRKLWDRIMPELDWAAARRKFLFWCLAAFFMLIALARPQWGEREETVKTTGLDMMIVLDVSKSMDTEDVVPSRLKKARRSLRYLLERMQGDRVGLVLYAGSAHLNSPLTTDLNYIQELIDEASPMSVTNQGTDIGAALEVAVRALDRGAEQLKRESEEVPKTRIILLVGDGEDHENQIEEGAAKLREADVKFYSFGVGTEKGGQIPMRDENGQNHGYKRTKKGEFVVSKADFTALRRLADRVDGKFWPLGDSEMEVDALVNDLSALSRGELDERKIAIREERFQIFLAIGILFLLIELSLSLRRRMTDSKSKAAMAGLLLALFSSGTGEAQGSSAPTLKAYRENQAAIEAFEKDRISEAKRAFGKAQVEAPDSPDLSYNQGVVQLREGNVEEAIRGFQRATRQADENGEFGLAARSLYNEGIAHSARKDFDAAASAYVRALEANQKAPDADLEGRIRKNLELLTQQQQSQQNSDQSDDQREKSDQQKQDQNQSDSDKSGKNPNSDDQKGDEKKDPKGEQGEEQKPQDQQQAKKKKQEFKSQQLKPEDAERVMSELSRREQDLKARLERQKGRPQSLEKDW